MATTISGFPQIWVNKIIKDKNYSPRLVYPHLILNHESAMHLFHGSEYTCKYIEENIHKRGIFIITTTTSTICKKVYFQVLKLYKYSYI